MIATVLPMSDANRRRRLVLMSLCVAIAAWLISGFFVVDESEAVIVDTFGRRAAVYDRTEPESSDRGLHWSVPWPFSVVRRFDQRVQLLAPPGREVFTRDQKNLAVAVAVSWRIAKPTRDAGPSERPVERFFRSLGSISTAEQRLESRIRAAVASAMGETSLAELLTSSADGDNGGRNESGLQRLTSAILTAVKADRSESGALLEAWGIEIVDLRIRRLHLPEANRFAVFERMRSERARVAERFRSEGAAERLRIEAAADRLAVEWKAKASAEAERIRGTAQAEAVAVLNAVHSLDPELYEFQRSLDAYRAVLGEQTTLVLSLQHPLFRVLSEGTQGVGGTPANPVGPPADRPTSLSPGQPGP
jgi:membrane protease subunit HflC